MARLVVIPFGAPPLDLGGLARALESQFPLRAAAGSPEPVPPQGDDPRRHQYLTRPFLRALGRRRDPGQRALGLTAVDLYVPDLNFVFGEADASLGCAIVSVARLAEGLAHGTTHPRWFRRVASEAVHEVGHLWGLRHCLDPRCVMAFSNTLADTDRKSPHLCPRCALVLRTAARSQGQLRRA